MSRGAWDVRLTTTAEADFQEILRWTAGHFGARRASSYAEQIISALTRLTEGPTAIGVKARNDVMDGLYSLHLGAKGRHLILFRSAGVDEDKTIEVLRILHDAMDLPQHLPPNSDS